MRTDADRAASMSPYQYCRRRRLSRSEIMPSHHDEYADFAGPRVCPNLKGTFIARERSACRGRQPGGRAGSGRREFPEFRDCEAAGAHNRGRHDRKRRKERRWGDRPRQPRSTARSDGGRPSATTPGCWSDSATVATRGPSPPTPPRSSPSPSPRRRPSSQRPSDRPWRPSPVPPRPWPPPRPSPSPIAEMVLKHGDQFHRYDLRTGRWSRLDVHPPPEPGRQLV